MTDFIFSSSVDSATRTSSNGKRLPSLFRYSILVKKIWGGTFESEPDAVAVEFGNSLQSDLELFKFDLQCSIAHVRMLAKQKIVSEEDANLIEKGLLEIAQGGIDILPKDAEDIHSAIEIALTEKIGATAGRLHTARSRNDQVATDTRLWIKQNLTILLREIKSLQAHILSLAEKHSRSLAPGFTHQQPAQPITLGFHLLAYFWMLQRAGHRIDFAIKISDLCPLGSAALSGTTFEIDRHQTSAELGFRAPTPNALDATSDRSFVLDVLHSCNGLMLDLSRLAQEFILWSSPAFGFVSLSDEVTTGSSIMPQKRNPDMAELIRGRSSDAIAAYVRLSTTIKGLPLAYNRDFQDDKPPLFSIVKTAIQAVSLSNTMLKTAVWNTEKLAAAAASGFSTATEIADALAARGTPFRQAHEIVGRIVLEDQTRGEFAVETVRKHAPMLDEQTIMMLIDPQSATARRESFGGCGANALQTQLERAISLHRLADFAEID